MNRLRELEQQKLKDEQEQKQKEKEEKKQKKKEKKKEEEGKKKEVIPVPTDVEGATELSMMGLPVGFGTSKK